MDKEREALAERLWDAHCVEDRDGGEMMLYSGFKDVIAALTAQQEPVAMLLYCPRCQAQHIDAPEPDSGWLNPPHATHTCKHCELNWRPSNHNTVGVERIECLEPKHAERIAATAPPSGVQEGMLRAAEICRKRADEITHENCVQDMSTGVWEGGSDEVNAQIEILDDMVDAITRAAEQVNAEWMRDLGRSPETALEIEQAAIIRELKSQPADCVAVPRRILAEVLSHYGRSIDMHLCVAKHLPTLQALLAAAKEPRR